MRSRRWPLEKDVIYKLLIEKKNLAEDVDVLGLGSRLEIRGSRFEEDRKVHTKNKAEDADIFRERYTYRLCELIFQLKLSPILSRMVPKVTNFSDCYD